MNQLLEIMFSGFWQFVGIFLIICVLIHFTSTLCNRILRHYNIKQNGWPPSHLDADGDWEQTKGENE